MSFGSYLRTLRKEKKLTLKDIANKSGLSVGYVSQLELGTRAKDSLPSKEVIDKLAQSLEVASIELLREAGYFHVDNYEDYYKETAYDRLKMALENLSKLENSFLPNIPFAHDEHQNPIYLHYKGHLVTEKKKKQILTMLDILFDIESEEE